MQKENTILKRSLEVKRKRPRFNFEDRMFYSIFSRITDKARYHFTLVKPETVLKWIRRFTKAEVTMNTKYGWIFLIYGYINN